MDAGEHPTLEAGCIPSFCAWLCIQNSYFSSFRKIGRAPPKPGVLRVWRPLQSHWPLSRFISVAVIKCSDPKQLEDERFYLRSQLQVIVHGNREVTAAGSHITATAQGRGNTCEHVGAQSAPSTLIQYRGPHVCPRASLMKTIPLRHSFRVFLHCVTESVVNNHQNSFLAVHTV